MHVVLVAVIPKHTGLEEVLRAGESDSPPRGSTRGR